MNKSEIISKIHIISIWYLIFGWIFQSQRIILVFLIPTIQFQWLINNNQCVLTQIEQKLLREKTNENIIHDSFIGGMLKKYNLDMTEKNRELLINCVLYSSFIISYFMV